MLAHLMDSSIRALFMGLTVAGALLLIGRRRTAALEHALWLTVVCGMLVLFALGGILPRLPLRILDSRSPLHVSSDVAVAGATPTDPLFQSTAAASGHSPAAHPLPWQEFAVYAYFAAGFAFLAHFLTGILLARRLLKNARSTGGGNVFESSAMAVPVALGSSILLPLEWRGWDGEKLKAVMAHEGAHVRRHDSFFHALAGLNRCIFWFHPLAWILERRLSFLADMACDEASVAELENREVYARVLLEMARAASRGRLHGYVVTMAGPSHLRQRIDAILDDHRTLSLGLSRTAWSFVLLGGIPLVLFAGVAELEHRPPVLSIDVPHRATALPLLPSARKNPVEIAQEQAPSAPIQPAPDTPMPRFDEVTVKPCESGDAAGRGGRGGENGRGIPPSPPGELFIHCLNVNEIVNFMVDSGGVQLQNDPGSPATVPPRLQGGAPWIYTDLWTIDAKTTDPVASQWTFPGHSARSRTFMGPMLMAVLEDKFHLQTHRKVEEVDMYELTVAAGGSKLQPAGPDACIQYDPGAPLRASDMFPANGKPLCIMGAGWQGPNWTIDAAGQPIETLARQLESFIVGRPVLDKTGLTGLYTLHIKFAHDQSAPGRLPVGRNPFTPPTADDPLAPTLNAVLEEQLGLTLVPVKGPREFLVVDSAARP